MDSKTNMLKLAIMQPYFLPYIGYWQLIYASDIFVLYDNIEYSKKSWVNKNRILNQGTDFIFTIPLQKDSDYLNIKDRYISNSFNCKKIISQISSMYQKSPFFKDIK